MTATLPAHQPPQPTGVPPLATFVSNLLFTAEFVVVFCIIACVPYTEIDWKAYMQEVSYCMKPFGLNELDYSQIAGGTGPLVYPAGFVWLFSALRVITKNGADIPLAQYIFAAAYLSVLSIALQLHRSARLPLLATVPLFLSRRIRSLFVLRLFNDCWAILVAMIAVIRISRSFPSSFYTGRYRQWYVGCFFLSLAISLKMNILLFCPGLLAILVEVLPLKQVVVCGFIGVGTQLVLALPFLLAAPTSYLSRSFEVGRLFDHRWSVNYQFVSTQVFRSSTFHMSLLALSAVAYGLLWRLRWRPRLRLQTLHKKQAQSAVMASGLYLPHALTLLESNIIGLAFSRSLHYQFFTWFFFTLMFVLHFTRLPTIVSNVLFALIQYGFEVYPPTPLSSGLMVASFGMVVLSILFLGREPDGLGAGLHQSQRGKQQR